MPNGGELKIETHAVSITTPKTINGEELKAGDYICVSVSDTGEGMASTITEHAFEPFFTTKEPGKGTGLGLSMVYGFMRQSGGHATISSVEGKGTTVSLYLPQTAQNKIEPATEKIETPSLSDGDCILVVEDDPGVRSGLSKVLDQLGYSVREACDGHSALAVLEANSNIHTMLTDIVLPGKLNGPQIAEKVRNRLPDVNVVFMSGYSGMAFPDGESFPVDIPILRKPFSKTELAAVLSSASTSK